MSPKEIGRSKVIDIITSKHKGYFYDMPVIKHTLKSYTTMTTTPMLLNISNQSVG